MRLNQTSIAAIGVIAAALALSQANAQTLATPAPQNPPPNPQTLHVYSRETIVDVIVTDDKGNHVRNLTRNDFTVLEDGHPQPIRSLKETGVTRAAARPQPRLAPGTYTSAQTTPAAGPASILLIDSLNSPPLGPLYMRFVVTAQHEIEHYLKAMPEGTQVAIFSLSFRGLHLLQGFTSDRDQLLHAMDTNFLVLANGGGIKGTYDNLDALKEIAVYAAPIKGRKNLLWFAPGSPVLLLHDGGLSWSEGPPDMALIHRIMDTYELFTSEQIAVSPVDTRGAGVLGRSTLIEQAVADENGGVAFYNNNDIQAGIAKAIDLSADYYTLSYVPPPRDSAGHYHTIAIKVDRPGLHLVYRQGYNDEQPPPSVLPAGPSLMKASMEGQAPPAAQLLFNVSIQTGNGPLILANAARANSSAASAPQSEPPSTAASASIPDPFVDTDDPFAFADSFANSGSATAKPATAATPAGPPPAVQPTTPEQAAPPAQAIAPGLRPVTSKEKTRYTFLYSVPQSQISFTLRSDDSRTAALEFDIAAYDEFGHLVNGLSQTMHLPLAPYEYDEFIHTPFQFSQQLDLPPGAMTLRIGILDAISNKVGTLELQITSPKASHIAENASR
jgi:VWFA-related protein